jgi:hypothetical protein
MTKCALIGGDGEGRERLFLFLDLSSAHLREFLPECVCYAFRELDCTRHSATHNVKIETPSITSLRGGCVWMCACVARIPFSCKVVCLRYSCERSSGDETNKKTSAFFDFSHIWINFEDIRSRSIQLVLQFRVSVFFVSNCKQIE